MAEEAKVAEKPKSKKMLIIAIAAVVLLGGGGAGAWFFMKSKHEPDPHVAEEAQRKKEMKAKVFVTLEPFTVNLADEEDRFAQVAVVLEVINNETAEEIKTLMPAVRSKILLLLSSKQSRDLLSIAGMKQLANEIAETASRSVGWAPPKAVAPKKKKKKAEEEQDDE